MASFHFSIGQVIEVTSNKHGFRGSWFLATIKRMLPKTNRAAIEYHHFTKTADSDENLVEYVGFKNLRPLPMRIAGEGFGVGEEVEVFWGDGWWEGKVKSVLDGGRYSVYFEYTEQELEYEFEEMRVYQKWDDGVWRVPRQEEHQETSEVSMLKERFNNQIPSCIRKLKQASTTTKVDFPNHEFQLHKMQAIDCPSLQMNASTNMEMKRHKVLHRRILKVIKKRNSTKPTNSGQKASVKAILCSKKLVEPSEWSKLLKDKMTKNLVSAEGKGMKAPALNKGAIPPTYVSFSSLLSPSG